MSTTKPEALLIAEECRRRSEDSRYERNLFRRAAAELRRLHAYAAELESQVIADCMAGGAGGVSPLMGAAGDAGWVMVPKEPTLAMGWAYLDAARESEPLRTHLFNHDGYRAMIAAAPSSAKGVAHG